jgi:multiple sugar transport system substrate-binding protein
VKQSLPAYLKGIAWDHSRGYTPLVAASQVFKDFHPDVEVHWAKRSLWEFGEGDLASLANEYDLLVLDYPLIGDAAESGLLLPLDGNLDEALLARLACDTVGGSYRSYAYGGHQWAVPVDAAAMVGVSRADLLAQFDIDPPTNWGDAVTLARKSRRVIMPLSPIDALCAFFSLCANLGSPPCFGRSDEVVDHAVGIRALAQLRDIACLVPRECFSSNPIQVMNRMSTGDDWLYCPLAFGYSNYARAGYAPHRLKFHEFPGLLEPYYAGAVLGGAGLAISARSHSMAEALGLMAWLVGDECQSTVYAYSGGQPARRSAWRSDEVNGIADNYFRATERTLESAYIRPNCPGMAYFQTRAAAVVWHYLQGGGEADHALTEIDRWFVQSTSNPGIR